MVLSVHKQQKNRILPTLSLPEMPPNDVEREAEGKRVMLVQALTDWLEIYQTGRDVNSVLTAEHNPRNIHKSY